MTDGLYIDLVTDDGTFLGFPPQFPFKDLALIGEQLTGAGICIPGYVPPAVGLFSTVGLRYEQGLGIQTVLLPDRNVVSRMAQLASGRKVIGDEQLRLAAALLGFCQCWNIEVEPGVAFLELGCRSGNAVAWEELRHFRLADSAHGLRTLDVALGRATVLELRGAREGTRPPDLSRPSRKWLRNYVIALKILELEATSLKPADRVLSLLEWMAEDFMFGSPAALLAMVFFAPNSPPKRRVFKDRNSADRQAALGGVRNAAWDLTQLSDFIDRVNAEGTDGKRRYLFASFDGFLRRMANLIFQHGTVAAEPAGLANALAEWWPRKDADLVCAALTRQLLRVQSPEWKREKVFTSEMLQELVANGEARVRGLGSA